MYFIKRLLLLPPLLFLIILVAFVLVRAAPGGPFDKERKPASPEIEKRIKARYHLDEPVAKQFLRYLGSLLHGDLGPSLKLRNHTVNEIIAQGLPISMTLGGLAFLVTMGVGVPLGFFTAIQKNAAVEWWMNFVALLWVCVPALVLGPVLVMYFAIKHHWFPVALWDSPMHAVLPTLTLALYFAGKVARLTREGMAGVLHADMIRTARAKGLSERRIFFKHALPLAILPVLSYSGPLLADLLTGSFVVENIFQIPGIGVFIVNSSLNRDYPLIVGLVIIYALILLLLNLAVDFAYGLLDPRARIA